MIVTSTMPQFGVILGVSRGSSCRSTVGPNQCRYFGNATGFPPAARMTPTIKDLPMLIAYGCDS